MTIDRYLAAVWAAGGIAAANGVPLGELIVVAACEGLTLEWWWVPVMGWNFWRRAQYGEDEWLQEMKSGDGG